MAYPNHRGQELEKLVSDQETQLERQAIEIESLVCELASLNKRLEAFLEDVDNDR